MKVLGKVQKFPTVTFIKTLDFQANGNNMKMNSLKQNQSKR